MPVEHILVASLPMELVISGHSVRLTVAWEEEARSYALGDVTAHFTGRSGRPIAYPLGGCCRNPDCVVMSIPADPVAQRIAAALLAQGLGRPPGPPPPATGTIGLAR